MKNPAGFIFFLCFLFLLDAYVYLSVKHLSSSMTDKGKWWVNAIYWTISVLSICAFILFLIKGKHDFRNKMGVYFFSIAVGLFIAKLIAMLIFLMDDGRRAFQWLWIQGVAKASSTKVEQHVISRSTFMSWLGLSTGVGLFATLLYGFGNKYRFRVVHQKIKFDNLPAAFRGIKILQISDIHCGSFLDKEAVVSGVKMINEQNADIILFTGDLVNNLAEELNDYKEVFAKLKAPLGVYSVLGNHDYGDYISWPEDGVAKQENFNTLIEMQKQMGWHLLMNEHVILERGLDQIAIIGIENWGAKAGFKQYGKMELAYPGTEKIPFKILMSHDPSHWKSQVRTTYPDIDLTLSGHTHGMQFGVELPGIKWSPIQYVYKEWAGLYNDGGKMLYVNRGFGFLGYPGRVGVLPEITLLELV